MAPAVETKHVTGRRTLRFETIDDILKEVESLAKAREVRALGNWSAGQVLKHLSITMDNSIDGAPMVLPSFLRFLLRVTMKKRILTKPMAPGFRLPKKAASLIPPPTGWEEGLQSFRRSIQRLKTESKRDLNPVVGKMTREEWDQLHCRHAELHLSFLTPEN